MTVRKPSPLEAVFAEDVKQTYMLIYPQENRRLFDIINKAICILCLDQRTSHDIYGTPEGGNDAEQNLALWAGQMLHGGGSSFNR